MVGLGTIAIDAGTRPLIERVLLFRVKVHPGTETLVGEIDRDILLRAFFRSQKNTRRIGESFS